LGFARAGSNPAAVVKKTYKFLARLAQSVERKTFNLVVVGSSPTSGNGVEVSLKTLQIFKSDVAQR
tara:strand:- start:245 stop:442 length:198 start_codon:yes stop_codon:yes gene_type:complete